MKPVVLFLATLLTTALAQNGYPVTLQFDNGEVTLETAPVRVAALGLGSLEVIANA